MLNNNFFENASILATKMLYIYNRLVALWEKQNYLTQKEVFKMLQ